MHGVSEMRTALMQFISSHRSDIDGNELYEKRLEKCSASRHREMISNVASIMVRDDAISKLMYMFFSYNHQVAATP